MITKEEIDRLFETNSNEEFCKLIGIEIDKFVQLDENEQEKIYELKLKKYINEIKENNLYEYFLNQGKKDDNIYIFAEIIHVTNGILSTKFVEEVKNKELDTETLIYIVEASENFNDIKQLIKEQSSKFKKNELQLVKLINNPNIKMECIKDKDFGWDIYDQGILIKSLNNLKDKKKCLKDKNFGWDTNQQILVIKMNQDLELIKDCIKDEDFEWNQFQQFDLIQATNDADYIESCIKDEDFEWSKFQQKDLIKAMGDSNRIIKYIKDKSFDWNLMDQLELMKAIEDSECIEKCLKDESFDWTLDKIKAINDPGWIKIFVKNNESKLSDKDKLDLSILTKDEELIQQYIVPRKQQGNKKIKLPTGITIGVEIEADKCKVYGNLMNGWKGKNDGTVYYGSEIVSPVLTGTKEDVNDIYNMCNMLQTLEAKATESCGGHVHIGANYLTSQKSFENLVEIWGNTEDLLYIISNKEQEITRIGGVNMYSPPISLKLEQALQEGSIQINNEDNLDDFVTQLQEVQGTRYSGINFMNAKTDYKKTIEFRLANGTIDPDTWIENINLFGGIVSASEKLKDIQDKPLAERTEEENKYLNAFDELKNPELAQEEKLNNLLELTIPQEDREVYQNRYRENSKLLNMNPILKESLDEQIASEPISLHETLINTYERTGVHSSQIAEVQKEAIGGMVKQPNKKNIEQIQQG